MNKRCDTYQDRTVNKEFAPNSCNPCEGVFDLSPLSSSQHSGYLNPGKTYNQLNYGGKS